MNNNDKIFQGWMSDLEDDDEMEPLLDAKDDGHDDKSTDAPEKCIQCQLDVPILVTREHAHQLWLKELRIKSSTHQHKEIESFLLHKV